MITTVVRSLLARSALKQGHRYAFTSAATTSKSLSNIMLAQRRLFSVSTRLASPAAAKPTIKKKTATKVAPKKKVAVVKKKATASTASKKKKTTTKKAAPKRKVAAKKPKVVVRKRKVKKVVPVKVTPRNNPALRAPPRTMTAFSLYLKRMWPTLSPKPASAPEGMVHIKPMWASLTAAEKKPFADEATILTRERREIYDKWRAGLSPTEVRAINAYRKDSKHNKLGKMPSSGIKKPATGYIKFYQESLKNGTVDITKAPAGTRPVIYASKEASRLWKGMSKLQKDAYA